MRVACLLRTVCYSAPTIRFMLRRRPETLSATGGALALALLQAWLLAAAAAADSLGPRSFGRTSSFGASAEERVASASPEASRPLPELELTLANRTRLSQRMTAWIKKELETLIGTLGAEIVWMAGPEDGHLYFPSSGIQVVLSSSSPGAWGLPENVMGIVVPTSHRPRRLIIVFPHWLAQVLGPPYDSRPPGQIVDVRFAHSLSRIIAHEILHALSPEHPHAARGLMHRQQSRSSLLRAELAVDPGSAAAFRTALESLAADTPANGPVASPR